LFLEVDFLVVFGGGWIIGVVDMWRLRTCYQITWCVKRTIWRFSIKK